ncbi:gluconokinase [Methylopila turkensis]|uniref:Gluconokinase n=1 Tax=Methylopila turkensis TaxID=1437816 RepID=A0A9W6JJE7_9HYPH|nr:gluconokinase [Methylopila turkensis]GLK78750.1 gluconokinase [Methylopila turkensis]
MPETQRGARCVVVMGPSGVGKTTVAKALAGRLGWLFAEADEFHPPANIEQMSAGIPLDDDDRAPWLASIRDWISDHGAAGSSSVVTCSALKRRYREVLRGATVELSFVELVGELALVKERMAKRTGHYMPVSLLDSQFEALEKLAPDETDGVLVDVNADPDTVVARALAALGLGDPAPRAVAARG